MNPYWIGQCILCPTGPPGPPGPIGPQGVAGRDGRDGRDASFGKRYFKSCECKIEQQLIDNHCKKHEVSMSEFFGFSFAFYTRSMI